MQEIAQPDLPNGVYIQLKYVFLVISVLAGAVSTLFMLWRRDRATMETKYEKLLGEQNERASARENIAWENANSRITACRECWTKWEQKLLSILYDYNNLARRIADATDAVPPGGDRTKPGG